MALLGRRSLRRTVYKRSQTADTSKRRVHRDVCKTCQNRGCFDIAIWHDYWLNCRVISPAVPRIAHAIVQPMKAPSQISASFSASRSRLGSLLPQGAAVCGDNPDAAGTRFAQRSAGGRILRIPQCCDDYRLARQPAIARDDNHVRLPELRLPATTGRYDREVRRVSQWDGSSCLVCFGLLGRRDTGVGLLRVR
jgi:hypothetical protein